MTDAAPNTPSPYLVPDEEARALARCLARTGRHAALGWLDPGEGAPMTSRVALAADIDGSPILCLSQLSAHTQGLKTDRRLSLLVGEPGAGDPLRQPRLSIAGTASLPIGPKSPDHERIARRFIARHASAAHYSGFADFAFFRVEVRSALLNAGFARAYHLALPDVVDAADPAIAGAEARVVAHMNDDHADVLDRLMTARAPGTAGWRIATLDRRGFELVSGSRIERVEFAEPVRDAAGFRPAFVALARSLDG